VANLVADGGEIIVGEQFGDAIVGEVNGPWSIGRHERKLNAVFRRWRIRRHGRDLLFVVCEVRCPGAAGTAACCQRAKAGHEIRITSTNRHGTRATVFLLTYGHASAKTQYLPI
jgi:hypothetical protein